MNNFIENVQSIFRRAAKTESKIIWWKPKFLQFTPSIKDTCKKPPNAGLNVPPIKKTGWGRIISGSYCCICRRNKILLWQNFVGDVIDRIYDVITFISKYLYFRKVWGSHFCWHDQNFDRIFRTIYKDWRKVKINRKYESKYNLYLYFVI